MSAPMQVSGERPGRRDVPRMRAVPRFVDALDLVALPTAVPVARMFIADTLHRWHALFIEEHMEPLAVELVTLSVKATSPAEGTSWNDIVELNPIRLRMLGYERHIVFEVTDAHDKALLLPANRNIDESTGLGLVDALAYRWGSFVTPQGRVIWAELSVYERTEAGLPKRNRRPSPALQGSAVQPAHATDPELLRRVRDGLENL
jgi:hypothetical protein